MSLTKRYLKACFYWVFSFSAINLQAAPISHSFQVRANIEDRFASTKYTFKGIGGGAINTGHLLIDASGRIHTNYGVNFTLWQKPPGEEETQVLDFDMKWTAVEAFYRDEFPNNPMADEVISDIEEKIKISVDGVSTPPVKGPAFNVVARSGFNTVTIRTDDSISEPTTGNKLVVRLTGVHVSPIE